MKIYFLFSIGMMAAIGFQACNKAERKSASDNLSEQNDSISNKGPHKALTLIIENIASDSGMVRVGVFGRGNKFPSDDDQLRTYKFTPKKGRIEETINDLEYGELAFAAYYDANNNKEIDKNGLGIPTEPYGFSNDARPILKAPDFEDCKIDYNDGNNLVRIKLNTSE